MSPWRGRTKLLGTIAAAATLWSSGPAVHAVTGSGDPIELPDALSGGLMALDLPAAYPDSLDAAEAEEQAANRRAGDEYNAAGFSAALGGVPAAARVYAGSELDVFYGVVAVRAELSPLLPFAFIDPEAIGLAKPTIELVWIDDVGCLVSWAPVVAGGEVTDEDRQNVMCQRTADGVTVRVNANTGVTPEHLAALAVEVAEAVA